MVKIVQSAQFVTLIGAGSVTETDLHAALQVAPILIAADGGADRALDLGLTPRAAIGDLDSLDPHRASAAGIPVHRVDDQDTTDFDKALAAIDAAGVIALGVLGPRADHALAAFSTLARFRAMAVVAIGDEDAAFHLSGEVALDLEPGTRVSLFPLAPVRVTAKGLEWPLSDLLLDPLGRVGTSNRATDARVTLRADRPGLIVLLPKAWAGAAVRALARR